MVFGVANDEYVKDLLRWRRIVFHIHTTYLKQILVPASYSPLALKDDPSHRYVSTASEGLNPICILKMVNDPKLQCYWVGFAPSQIRFFCFRTIIVDDRSATHLLFKGGIGGGDTRNSCSPLQVFSVTKKAACNQQSNNNQTTFNISPSKMMTFMK